LNELHPTVRRMDIGGCALCEARTRVFCEICDAYVCEKEECKKAHAAIASGNDLMEAQEPD
jgi:hypothetical protein